MGLLARLSPLDVAGMCISTTAALGCCVAGALGFAAGGIASVSTLRRPRRVTRGRPRLE